MLLYATRYCRRKSGLSSRNQPADSKENTNPSSVQFLARRIMNNSRRPSRPTPKNRRQCPSRSIRSNSSRPSHANTPQSPTNPTRKPMLCPIPQCNTRKTLRNLRIPHDRIISLSTRVRRRGAHGIAAGWIIHDYLRRCYCAHFLVRGEPAVVDVAAIGGEVFGWVIGRAAGGD